MADNIISLRNSYVLSLVERISELEAEIERLRAREQDLRMYAEQDACEIERLRAAGDALAEWAAVDHSVEQCEDGCEYFAALRVWQEARRG